MQEHAPEVVEFLKAKYRSAVSGNFDIYVCFIERGLELLRPNGRFGYITPNKFFQSEYGEELRRLLSEGRHVSGVVNFEHQQVFPQATIYTCLLLLRREPQAGSADLAALETEIGRLDGEIDAAVYELYGLTPEEVAVVEGRGQGLEQSS